MPLDLDTIPILDHHCHSLYRAQPQTTDEWRKFFTESYYPEIARDHVPYTIFYQWAQRALAHFYGCAANDDAILEKRNAYGLAELTQKINADANIQAWLVDYGYSTTHTFGHDELKNIAGVRVEKVLRLEVMLEQFIVQANAFDAVHDLFDNALHDLRGKGYVSLKSIMAYRTGLQIQPTTHAQARAEFAALKERATRDGKLRLANQTFLNYFIPRAVEIAARQEFPIQFHTGFGDPDLDLAQVNPAFLRPLFEEEKYRGAKIVLLHAAYPYARTLGYLAAVYPNVYADFGLAIPFVAGDARAVLRDVLGLAPASKVLYSSDAFHIPELYWLGAKLGRRALGDVLAEYVADDLITGDAAREMAELMLWRNAARVYGVNLARGFALQT
ncbi:MAG: amidohydrolase family protein [Chloroflexi bacterium]|nr:amidohydrolase family protein [Chloroflexota bacterium]